MKLENSFWIRHFLMCNEIGNKILHSNRQIENVNFADIIRGKAEKRISTPPWMHFASTADTEFLDKIVNVERSKEEYLALE